MCNGKLETSDQKKPQAGEWWIHDSSGDKAYFIGECPAGVMVWQIDGDDIEHGNLDWSGWHHEPRCTGWEWQPEPEWFDLTPFDGHVLRRKVDQLSIDGKEFDPVFNFAGLSVFASKHRGFRHFRCMLKDVPPELVAKGSQPVVDYTEIPPEIKAEVKSIMDGEPAEDPDEWVTITDENHIARRGIDYVRMLTRMHGETLEPVNGLAGLSKSQIERELACRRRDLPPIPETP